MTKTILLTGATDGIGLETAKLFAAQGHTVLMHGRSDAKLKAARAEVGGTTLGYLADLSVASDITAMAQSIAKDHAHLDVLINNAGVLKMPNATTPDGLDARFMVNTIAPYILTEAVLPLMGAGGRIINLSSAAQAPVDLDALKGDAALGDMEAYAQSKLAITMWSQHLAAQLTTGPSVLAVNPGSLLASKMVKEGFGVAGNDLSIGAQILYRTALEDEFANVSGRYFDNDAGAFGQPHADASDPAKVRAVVQAVKDISNKLMNT
ncbi:Oxidoreductase, short chain dehydrogenase/reductase family protein [Sulfitobacter noctilucae]|uniref:SDR family NAD(P)-dependent oxidoreductase n=1 Tax=Sulfitobacter noctilucae TaxID=1342302 RepID=UPI00046A9E93|nr:SDR family NAD(P)-dependent oxidoreductase [Sulfitobacter noctilucae]KIN70545.1 Oxidoreductase, short chain dehydrogenase/reductase family protein [Sulfitobacter noctilucae]